MEQTVIKIGNSIGIAIPSIIRKQLKIEKGDKIIMVVNNEEETITLEKTKKKKPSTKISKYNSSITPEILRVMDRVNKEYSAAFAKLAKK